MCCALHNYNLTIIFMRFADEMYKMSTYWGGRTILTSYLGNC